MANEAPRYAVDEGITGDTKTATGPSFLASLSDANIGKIKILHASHDIVIPSQPSPQPPSPGVAVNVIVKCEHSEGEGRKGEKDGARSAKEVPGMFALLAQLWFRFPSLSFPKPAGQVQELPAPEVYPPIDHGGDSGHVDVQMTSLDKSKSPLGESPSDPAYHEVYVQTMLQEKLGLPCWSPGSTDPKMHPVGVVPGDVGTYTILDGFQISFNLFEDQATLCQLSEACNSKGRCRGLKHQYSTKPDYFQSGDTITRGASVEGQPTTSLSVAPLHKFRCYGTSGAILAMPTPVDIDKAHSPAELDKYVRTHAEAIYRHANDIRPIGEDESLYVVTDCIKSGSWAMAAYKDEMHAEHNTLELVSIFSEPDGQEGGLPKYSWTKRGSAQTRWGKSPDGHVKDQALFIRGFKLAFSGAFRRRMERADEDNESGGDESNSDGPKDERSRHEKDRPSGGFHQGDNNQETSGSSMQGSSQGSGQGSQAYRQSQMLAYPGVDFAPFPATTYAPYHPSDVINTHILLQTGCDISICHDDTWCQLIGLEDSGNKMMLEIFPLQARGSVWQDYEPPNFQSQDSMGAETIYFQPVELPVGIETEQGVANSSAVSPLHEYLYPLPNISGFGFGASQTTQVDFDNLFLEPRHFELKQEQGGYLPTPPRSGSNSLESSHSSAVQCPSDKYPTPGPHPHWGVGWNPASALRPGGVPPSDAEYIGHLDLFPSGHVAALMTAGSHSRVASQPGSSLATAPRPQDPAPLPAPAVRNSARFSKKRALWDDDKGEAAGKCVCGKFATEGLARAEDLLMCSALGCKTVWYHKPCFNLESVPEEWTCEACAPAESGRPAKRAKT